MAQPTETIRAAAMKPVPLPSQDDQGRAVFSITFVNDKGQQYRPCTKEVYEQCRSARYHTQLRSDFLINLNGGVVTSVSVQDKPSSTIFKREESADREYPGAIQMNLHGNGEIAIHYMPERCSEATAQMAKQAVASAKEPITVGVMEGGFKVLERREKAGMLVLFIEPPAV